MHKRINTTEDKKMFKRFKVIPVLVAITIASITLVACGHRHFSPEERAEWVTERISDHLDLNAAQLAKLNAVTEEYLADQKQFKQGHVELIDQLIAEVKSPALNQDTLLNIIETRKAAFESMAPRVIARLADFHASLNDEQKEKIVKKLEKIKERHY
jgi:hypothetical protein